MSATVQDILVRKSIVIEAPQQHVFSVFTESQDAWWPRSHHIGPREKFSAVLERKAGGRWYELGDDGSECNWGRVLAWEPPDRIVVTWEIDADFKPAPGLDVEIEVKFIAEGPRRTRVELEHRKLQRYGDKAEMMRAMFDSPNAWMAHLVAMKAVAEK